MLKQIFLIIFLFTCLPVCIAQRLTYISDYIYYDSTHIDKATGYVDITWLDFTNFQGIVIPAGNLHCNIKDGYFNLPLYSNKDSHPLVDYNVTFHLDDDYSIHQEWIIPNIVGANVYQISTPKSDLLQSYTDHQEQEHDTYLLSSENSTIYQNEANQIEEHKPKSKDDPEE